MKISNVEYHESLRYLEGERSQSLIANVTKAVSATFSRFMNVKRAINTLYSEFLVDNTRRYFTSCVLFFRDPQWRRKMLAMSKMSTHISSIVRPAGPLRLHLLDDEVFWVEREKRKVGQPGFESSGFPLTKP